MRYGTRTAMSFVQRLSSRHSSIVWGSLKAGSCVASHRNASPSAMTTLSAAGRRLNQVSAVRPQGEDRLLGIPGQFHIASARDGRSVVRAIDVNGAFPVAHGREELLVGYHWFYGQVESKPWHGKTPF